jgi:hypothetical protein
MFWSAPIRGEAMNLTIPDSDREKFARLVALTPTELDSLYDALKEMSPQLRQSRVVEEIAPRVAIDRVILADVVRLLLTLYSVRADQNLDPAEMAEQLAIAAQGSTDERLKNPPADWNNLKPHLARLLDLERSFGITAKASFVRYEYASHFHGARILTDARPIFTSDPTTGPAAFIVNHTLHIELSTSGDEKDFFLSVNSLDLTTLRNMINRALAKEASLRSTLSITALPVLDVAENSE